jgi:hypothetical protein
MDQRKEIVSSFDRFIREMKRFSNDESGRTNLSILECDSGMIVSRRSTENGRDNCMTMEPTKLQHHHKRHLEDLKKQIARCLEKELSLLAEERSERAQRMGLPHKIAPRPQ